MVGKDLSLIPLPVEGILSVIAAREACTFQGESMHRLGVKNDKGLQGYGIYISDDGFSMHEGFFVDNEKEGLQRHIKLSKRRPGCCTIRECEYMSGAVVSDIKQVKYDAEGNRTEDRFEVENGFFKEGQSKPETRC